MCTTTIDKPNSKRVRKFAREPQGESAGTNALPSKTANIAVASAPPGPRPKSKVSLLLELLARPEGATLERMVAATDWLPHTTRAALTGRKKKGHTVTSIKTDGVRTYRVVMAESAPITSPAEAKVKVEA